MLHQLWDQVSHVDPLVWIALTAPLTPYAHILIKKFVDLSYSQNVLVAALLASVVSFLSFLANAGVVGRLHNPLLELGLGTGLHFILNQNWYGTVIKKQETIKALTPPVQY